MSGLFLQDVGNKPVGDVVETWLKQQPGRVAPRRINTPAMIGLGPNAGLSA